MPVDAKRSQIARSAVSVAVGLALSLAGDASYAVPLLQVLNDTGANAWTAGTVWGGTPPNIITNNYINEGNGVSGFFLNRTPAASATFQGGALEMRTHASGNSFGILELRGAGQTYTVANSGLFLDSARVTNTSGGNVTLNGSVTLLATNPLFGTNLLLPASSILTVGGPVVGGGGMSVTGGGTGTVVLSSNANTYSGGTIVNSNKTLRQGQANALTSGTGDTNIAATGTLDLGGFSGSVAGLVGSGTVSGGGAGGTPSLTLGADGVGDKTSGAAIIDGGSTLAVTKVGDNRQTLTAASSYTGGTTINEGQLQVSGAGTLGSGAVSVGQADGLNQATLELNGATLGNNLTLVGYGATSPAHVDNLGGGSTVSGAVTLADVSPSDGVQDEYNLLVGSGTLVFNASGNITANGDTDSPQLNLMGDGTSGSIAGTVSLNGAGSGINKTGAATWNVGAASALDAMDASGTGTLTVGAVTAATGDLALSGDGDGVVTGAVTLAGAGNAINKTGDGDWNLSGTVGGLDAINADGTGILTANDVTGVGGLALGGTSLNGVLTGTIAPNGDLDKNDAGTWTVDGTVDGTATAINVNTGTLALGSSADVSAVPVIEVDSGALLDAAAVVSGTNGGWDLASGQTLAGSGTVSGDVTALSGSAIEIGQPFIADISTLTFTGDLILDPTSTLNIDVDPTGTGSIDFLSVAGLLDINTSVDFIAWLVPPAVALNDPAYVFAEYGTLTGTFDSADAPTGYYFDYLYNGNNEIALVRAQVPTPPPLALMGLGALVMGGLRKRAKR